MTVVEALHMGVNHSLEQHQYLLHQVDGEVMASKLGYGQDTEVFKAGVKKFDLVVGSYRHEYPNLWTAEEDQMHIRGVLHGAQQPRILEASVLLEPLPDHPLYDPAAEAQYFVSVHHLLPGRIYEIDPWRVRPHQIKIVQLVERLGRLAQATV